MGRSVGGSFFGSVGVLLSLTLGITRASAGTRVSELMVTAGDSISAGFLSNWRAQRIDQKSAPDADESDFPPHPRYAIPWWRIRLGQALNHKYTLSWSSGFDLSSHYLRLKADLAQSEPGVDLKIMNVAFSGAVVADLDRQADAILSAWRSRKYRNIPYLTLTIGANDTCAPWFEGGNPDSEIEAGIRGFFTKLAGIRQPKPIRVLVAAIPKIPDLGKPEILHHWLTPKMTCEYRMRYRDHYCNSLIFWSNAEEYRKDVAIVEHKNDVIRNLLAELSRELPQFEFAFGESLYRKPITISVLSKDCFHPNPEGQTMISELLWADQPWFP